MRAIVVGASGFIGQNVTQRLQTDQRDVLPVGGESRIESTPADAAGWRDLFATHGPFDVCINCAGRAHVGRSISDPLQDFSGNSQLVFWLLDAIRQNCSDCRFLNISSAAVYGTPERLPIEESQALRPISPYGWHKRIAEQICEEYSICYGLRTCSVRGFSVYGPGLRKQLFWELAARTRQPGRLELYGTGLETRDFIYIDDFVDALIAVLESAEFYGECINVASGTPTSIQSAATLFLKAFGYDDPPVFSGATKSGDPTAWHADITKLASLGFHPRIPFEQGIEATAKWIKSFQGP